MKLNILIVQESQAAKIPKNNISFRCLAHHVSEIFLNLLPKININDSRKITLEFGPKGNEDTFDAIFGCTNYFIENFNFDFFYSLSKFEQEKLIVEEIKTCLIEIYKRRGHQSEEEKLIALTAEKVLSIGCNLDIPIEKLKRTTEDRKFVVEVHRILNAEVGEAWKCIVINKKDQSLHLEKWITNIPNYLDRTDFFKNAEIKNGCYSIINNLGKVTFHLKIE